LAIVQCYFETNVINYAVRQMETKYNRMDHLNATDDYTVQSKNSRDNYFQGACAKILIQ